MLLPDSKTVIVERGNKVVYDLGDTERPRLARSACAEAEAALAEAALPASFAEDAASAARAPVADEPATTAASPQAQAMPAVRRN